MPAAKQIKLSSSTLNLYRDCPRCFWLHANADITRPRGAFPSLPGGMDSVIKQYFEPYRRLKRLPPIISGKVPGLLAPVLPKWLVHDRDEPIMFLGKLDELIVDDGLYAPLDHKTRASAPTETHESYQLQMDCYTFLLEANDYHTNHRAYLVYFYPEHNDRLHEGFPFGVHVKTLDTDPNRAKEMYEKAKEVLAGPSPKAGEHCEYCRWLDRRNAFRKSRTASSKRISPAHQSQLFG